MRKLAYISIGAIFTLLISFSWITWADSRETTPSIPSSDQPTVEKSNPETTQGEISYLDQEKGMFTVFDGKQKHNFSLNTQAKVLINEKQSSQDQLALGEEVQVFCNSDGAVRYIVVNRKENVSAAAATTNSQPTTVAPQAVTVTSENRNAELLPYQKFNVDLKQGENSLEIKVEGKEAKITWQTPEGKKEYKGSEAIQLLQAWYAKLSPEERGKYQSMIHSLATSAAIDAEEPFTYKIEWDKDGEHEKWESHDQGKHLGQLKKKHGKEGHGNGHVDD